MIKEDVLDILKENPSLEKLRESVKQLIEHEAYNRVDENVNDWDMKDIARLEENCAYMQPDEVGEVEVNKEQSIEIKSEVNQDSDCTEDDENEFEDRVFSIESSEDEEEEEKKTEQEEQVDDIETEDDFVVMSDDFNVDARKSKKKVVQTTKKETKATTNTLFSYWKQ